MKRFVFLIVGTAGLMLVPATAQASVNAAWSPQTGAGTFAYGTVEIGKTPGQTFHLTNSGTSKTAPLRIKLAGASAFKAMRDTCRGKRLAPGKSCLVRIQYTPATDGQTDTATLTAGNGTLTATYATITITGAAHGTADLEWSASSHDFGTTAGTFETTLTNVGTAAAFTYIWGSEVWGGGLLAANTSCSYDISEVEFAPGATCTETWTFDPTKCGSDSVHGPISGGEFVGEYYVDSTHTTSAGPANFTANATCP